MNGVNRAADPGGCVEVKAVLSVFPAVLGVRRCSVDWVVFCYLFIYFGNFSVYKYKRTK